MRAIKYIEGEQNRQVIVKYLTGKQANIRTISTDTGLVIYKVEHYLKNLLVNGYVQRVKIGGNRIEFKLTRIKYKPKDVSHYEKLVQDQKNKIKPVKVKTVVVPTISQLRVIKLLDRPLAPAPRSKRSNHLYGGMQSGLGMFDGV